MTSTSGWTPAPRPGLVPLHPYGFGTVLGRSFAALRGNPKVLLGFAMVVQMVGSIVGLLIIGVVAFWSFSRLDTVEAWSDDFDAIMAGSVLATALTTIAVSLLLGAINVVVQGVVVGEVAHAALGERATLRMLWARVRPAFWPLLGYFLLLTLATVVVLALMAAPFLLLFSDLAWVPFVSLLVTIPGAIALWLWLGTKLYLVPSAIVLEGAGVRGGIARSWVLTRGRFWPTLGVMVLVSLIMSVAAYVVSVPFSLLTQLLIALLIPAGGEGAGAAEWIGVIAATLLSQAVSLLVSAIGVVVQATSAALVYVDARMRREGLDLRLQAHVERRELGAPALSDPWAFDPSHVAPPRPAPVGPAYAPAGYGYPPQGHPQGYAPPAQGHPQPGYAPPQGYPQPGQGYAPPQGHPQPPAYPQPPYPQPPYPPAPPQAAPPQPAPARGDEPEPPASPPPGGGS